MSAGNKNTINKVIDFPSVYGQVDRAAIAYACYIKEFADTIRGSKILDVGCGLGNYTKLFSVNNNEVTGIDIIDFRDKECSKYFHFIKYDGKLMPFKDEAFDVVTSLDVIEHVKDDLNFVKEIRRVQRKNGKLLIATPNRDRLVNALLQLVGKPPVFPMIVQEEGIGGKSIHYREYTGVELLDLFLKVGFKDIYIDYFWFGFRGVVNLGIPRFCINSLCNFLFLRNKY